MLKHSVIQTGVLISAWGLKILSAYFFVHSHVMSYAMYWSLFHIAGDDLINLTSQNHFNQETLTKCLILP